MTTTQTHTGALVFRLAEQRFALPLTSVTEVVRGALPMRAPRAPFGCVGLLDLRGDLVVLLDLAAGLGLRRPLKDDDLEARLVDAHVLITNVEGVPLALLVDQVREVDPEVSIQQLNGTEQTQLVKGGVTGLIHGAVEIKGERTLVLSLTTVINERRRRLLSDFVQRNARPT